MYQVSNRHTDILFASGCSLANKAAIVSFATGQSEDRRKRQKVFFLGIEPCAPLVDVVRALQAEGLIVVVLVNWLKATAENWGATYQLGQLLDLGQSRMTFGSRFTSQDLISPGELSGSLPACVVARDHADGVLATVKALVVPEVLYSNYAGIDNDAGKLLEPGQDPRGISPKGVLLQRGLYKLKAGGADEEPRQQFVQSWINVVASEQLFADDAGATRTLSGELQGLLGQSAPFALPERTTSREVSSGPGILNW